MHLISIVRSFVVQENSLMKDVSHSQIQLSPAFYLLKQHLDIVGTGKGRQDQGGDPAVQKSIKLISPLRSKGDGLMPVPFSPYPSFQKTNLPPSSSTRGSQTLVIWPNWLSPSLTSTPLPWK
jgi:hypothetical protein